MYANKNQFTWSYEQKNILLNRWCAQFTLGWGEKQNWKIPYYLVSLRTNMMNYCFNKVTVTLKNTLAVAWESNKFHRESDIRKYAIATNSTTSAFCFPAIYVSFSMGARGPEPITSILRRGGFAKFSCPNGERISHVEEDAESLVTRTRWEMLAEIRRVDGGPRRGNLGSGTWWEHLFGERRMR